MSSKRGKCALLWDESFLWGLMSYKALRRLGLGFELVRAEDVRKGALEDMAALFVPGGWASNKLKTLGDDGAEAVRRFVSGGGAYIGLCGGAGLATRSGLGLLEIDRKTLAERVPSLAGRVRLTLNEGDDSPLWDGVREPEFSMWWPSQFVLDDSSIKTLAGFDEVTPDAFSSDLSVRGMDSVKWQEAEEAYGINLDPARMKGDPVIVEGAYGKGTVIASLVHFDSPGSLSGERVLCNLWDRFALKRVRPRGMDAASPSGKTHELLSGLFDLGVKSFLWFRRGEPGEMIQWRRGVRGLEYFTLMELGRELSALNEGQDDAGLLEGLHGFSRDAEELLALEAEAIKKGEQITFKKASGKKMYTLRERLFGGGKSHGGLYKEILDRLDALLFERLIDAHEQVEIDKGRVHIYTGPGKGKTTAGVGLALRAKSRGLRVLYAQFMKETRGGETELLRKAAIEVRRFTEVLSPLFNPEVDMEDLCKLAEDSLEELGGMLDGYDLVVADEFNTMVARRLITEDAALGFISRRPEHVELVLTGRGATERLRQAADLVSEVGKIKH
ncbi:hypothetical protein LCGC14_1901100, partial [marine sediment metagenome]